MMTLAAIILTKDEERDLPDCLKSLVGAASEVFIVDSGSTDRTQEIAREYGATFLEHAFFNHAAQFNWALDNIVTEAEWILRIDADERLTPELVMNLRSGIAAAPEEVAGFAFPRVTRFLGTTIRWGGTYRVWLLRVWRRGSGRCEDAWMDEHIVLSHGSIERLYGDLIHEIPKSLTDWVTKHNGYATRECKDIVRGRHEDSGALSGQAQRNRWLKDNVYLRGPLFVRAFVYWFYRYFIRMGFLDGKAGLIYHFMQAFWYRFLVDAKLYEGISKGKDSGESE